MMDFRKPRQENLKQKAGFNIRLKAEGIGLPLQHSREHFLKLNFTHVVTVSIHTWQL